MTNKLSEKIDVLLIEDNEDDAFLIKQHLDKSSFTVTHIKDGKRGFDYIQENFKPEEVDTTVVLLDYRLPQMDGIEILEKMQKQQYILPVVFLTVDSSIDVAVDVMKAGADEFLPKFKGYDLLPQIVRSVHSHYINQLKEREYKEKLAKTEEQYGVLFESAKDGFFIYNREGECIDVNKSGIRLFGHKKDNVSIITEQILEGVKKDIEKDYTVTTIIPLFKKWASDNITPEMLLKRKDGTDIWVEITVSEIKQSTSYLVIFRDITEQYNQKEELIAAKENAVEANEAKTIFLGKMSHELRTPLNGIIGMTALTLATQLTGEQREFMEMVRSSSEHLLNIVNDLLTFSKIESGKMLVESSPLSIKDIITHVQKVFRKKAAKKNLTFNISIDETIPETLLGDPLKLKQVLFNLVDNAIKFTDAGTVSISALLKEESAGRYSVLFSVQDEGIGVSEDKMPKIFESFTQVDNSLSREYEGAGLGLTISSQLIHMMEGQIWVEGKLPRGVIFYFCLPFDSVVIPEDKQATLWTEVIETSNQNVSILLADDDYISHRLLKALFDKKGWKLSIAVNGKDAVDLWSKNNFDLILMDINMPEMDGYTAAKRIRELEKQRGESIVILALSAFAMEKDKKKSIDAGMNGHICKPIDPVELFLTIEKVLASQRNTIIIIDYDRVAAFLKKDKSLFMEIRNYIDAFFPQYMKEMKICVEKRKWIELVPILLKIKGSFSYFGAMQIIESIREVQELIKQEKFEDIISKLLLLEEKYKKFHEIIFSIETDM